MKFSLFFMFLTNMGKSCDSKELFIILVVLLSLITNITKSSRIEEYKNSSIFFAEISKGSGIDEDIVQSSKIPSESGRAHLFNRKTRKHFLKLFKRKIKIPEKSSLSLNTQVSRPNIFPKAFNQEEGIIIDGVLEWPMWLDLDDFAADMYGQSQTQSDTNPHPPAGGRGDEGKAFNTIGIERCFLYDKMEWMLGFAAQLSDEASHSCILKFICETQTIHSFYPEFPASIAFELVHLVFTPSFGIDDSCYEEYIVAENTGRTYGRCETYDSSCPFSLGPILIRNFFHLTVPMPEMMTPEDGQTEYLNPEDYESTSNSPHM